MGHETQPVWRRAGTHLLHVAFMLKAEIEERLQEATGLLLADNEALLHLSHAGEPLRMSDLADRLVLSRGGTTKVVTRLEEAGLATRTPNADDRRALLVEITEEGTLMLSRTRPIVDAALEDLWSRHLTDEDSERILEAVNKVLHGNKGWLG